MAVGDIITAARYNILQGRIANVMGQGSGDSGYGQVLNSSPVNVGNLITAEVLNNIFDDMLNARVHQTGSVPTTLERVNIGDLIAEDVSTDPDGNLKGFADYEDLVSFVENDRFLLDGSQSTESAGRTSTRTSQWNGVIVHEVRVNFGNADNARYFFNSGGELRLTANLSGGAGAKTTDWSNMLSAMGTIKFNYTETTATGTGSTSSIGFYELSSSYQTVFTKQGSGIYSQNQYKLEVKRPEDNLVDLKITLDDPAYQFDENVSGQLTSSIRFLRASGVYVSVDSPSFQNLRTL